MMTLSVPEVWNYEGSEVRVCVVDGVPWWVAADVCSILGLSNPSEALRGLDDDERGTLRITEGTSPSGGNPYMNVINESGLYALIMKSRKPEARRFRRWVTGEVLPAIRQSGAYLTEQAATKALEDPDFLIGLLNRQKQLKALNEKLSTELEAAAVPLAFAQAVSDSNNTILVRDLAALLRQQGVDIGQNRLFAWLREHGYLCKTHGERYNTPTQLSLNLGLFRVVERAIMKPDGESKTIRTAKVTGKGQLYFLERVRGLT